MICLNNCVVRPLSGKMTFKDTYVFSNKGTYMTAPFKNGKGVLVTTTNELLADVIKKETGCQSVKHCMAVPRAIAKGMDTDYIVLLNCYCNIDTKHEITELSYVYAPRKSLPLVKSRLQRNVFKNDI